MPVKRRNAGPSAGQKRTRFASPSPNADGGSSRTSVEPADDLLEQDLPQGASAAKARSKKQIQDADGYGSDSSNDDEGVVPSRRADAKEDEDEDMDMFADDVDEKADKGKGKGKGKDKEEFMSLDQIEGQEFDRRRGDSGTPGDSEDEADEESRKEKRKQGLDGDMGIDITPFNMKSEMEEGKFTADGESYIQNDRDPNEKHDMWLEDVDEESIRKARKAHKERERLEQEREEREEEEKRGGQKEKENEMLRAAVELMERGETILEALQRLGQDDKKRKAESAAAGKKKTWAERQRERKAEEEANKNADPIRTTNPFTNLSNIVSALTAIGHLDVYSLSRESIQRMLPAPPPPAVATNGSGTAAPAPTRAAPTDDRKFQYRFSMKYLQSLPEANRPVEREIFGPFVVGQLKQWRNTGFFGGPACEHVELRIAPEPGKEATSWGSWEQVVGP